MISIASICGLDASALGRFDYSSLSDQILMELLFENATSEAKGTLCGSEDANVCEWNGVQCDADGRVTEIVVRHDLGGTVLLSYMPQRATSLVLYAAKAQGPLNTHGLPPKLVRFNISFNAFDGSVDMTALPQTLQHFAIEANAFSGSCDFTSLPPNLVRLNADKNRFSGSLDLTRLPKSLVVCILSCNQFSGEIHLNELPLGLMYLWIHDNVLSGSFCFQNIPEEFEELCAQNNNFSGTAIVGALGADMFVF